MVPDGEKLPSRALVLGTGGASKAIAYVLQKEGIEYLKVSRTAGADRITYQDLTEETIKDHLLIINTTPLGTFPDVNRVGAKTNNGLKMLSLQAEKAWEIWNMTE